MFLKRTLAIPLLVIAALISGCKNTTPPQSSEPGVAKGPSFSGGSYTDISAEELHIMLAKKDFIFINVHVPFEGNIASTDLSIPYDQISQNLNKLPADKNAKIVLYCRSGNMSSIASKTLIDLGYTNVMNLSGGMIAWEGAGYPIDR
jgi:rhodanese-related sulfurtransferase